MKIPIEQKNVLVLLWTGSLSSFSFSQSEGKELLHFKWSSVILELNLFCAFDHFNCEWLHKTTTMFIQTFWANMGIGWECAWIAAEYEHLNVFDWGRVGANDKIQAGSIWTYRILSVRWISKAAIHFDLLYKCPPLTDPAILFDCVCLLPLLFFRNCEQNQRVSKLDQCAQAQSVSIVIFYATTQITVNRMGFLVHCILLQSDIFKLFQLVPTYTLFIHSFDLNYDAIWHEHCSLF